MIFLQVEDLVYKTIGFAWYVLIYSVLVANIQTTDSIDFVSQEGLNRA